MLKKVFVGLLVMSLLSSGLLVYLLKKKGGDKNPAPEVHMEETVDAAPAAPAAPTDPAAAEHAATDAVAETPHKEEEAVPANKLAAEEPAASDTEQTLRLLTEPGGASVFVDGEFIGNTPVDLQLKPAAIKVAIEAPGYKRFERSIPPKSESHEKGKSLFAAVMKIQLEAEKKGAAKKEKAHAKTNHAAHDAAPESSHAAEPSNDHSSQETHERVSPFKSAPKVSRRKVATQDRDYYIQVKSLPNQGAATELEVTRLTTTVREKSSFAVHSCSVDLDAKGRWTRVLLGPFPNKQEATTRLSEATQLGLDTEAPFVTGEQKCL